MILTHGIADPSACTRLLRYELRAEHFGRDIFDGSLAACWAVSGGERQQVMELRTLQLGVRRPGSRCRTCPFHDHQRGLEP